MGLDTKGIVITENKDVRNIARRIGKVVEKIKGINPKNPKINLNSSYSCEYNFTSNYLVYNFLDGADSRSLMVSLDCDLDNKDLGNEKIHLTLGCWGNNMDLMPMFSESLKDLGPCYIDENDCDESGWTLID